MFPAPGATAVATAVRTPHNKRMHGVERTAGPRVLTVPEGDDRERLVCPDCGYVAYENPKVIVGAVCVWDDRFLLCRRAIEPRRGYWTFPAGYMELEETTEAGAAREAWEEASASVTIGPLVAVYNLPRISQVHLIYRATMNHAHHAPGAESLETDLFRWDEIPWDALAYHTIRWSLMHCAGLAGATDFAPRGVPETGDSLVE